jgi:hypothetical protein
MAARINAYSSDDKPTRDVALRGEAHKMTVILDHVGANGVCLVMDFAAAANSKQAMGRIPGDG